MNTVSAQHPPMRKNGTPKSIRGPVRLRAVAAARARRVCHTTTPLAASHLHTRKRNLGHKFDCTLAKLACRISC